MLKVRRYDFSTLTRSETLRGPTDDPGVVREAALRLLDSVDTTGGVRLLGVGVTGLADYTQEDLFAQVAGERVEHGEEGAPEEPLAEREAALSVERRWVAGHDVRHAEHGHGWVQGSGLGRVTVRFETPESSGPGGCGRFGSTIRGWRRRTRCRWCGRDVGCLGEMGEMRKAAGMGLVGF